MRKLIAVMIMIFVVVFFYQSIQQNQPIKPKKKEVIEVITDQSNALDQQYPDNPMEIVEIHNEMINLIYGEEPTEEEVGAAINVQRKLYAEDFLALNPAETHKLEVARERTINKEKAIKVIGSKVMNSYNDPPGTIKAQVVHYTNKQDADLLREYIVKEEKSLSPDTKQWKIFGWTNIGVVKSQEEEE